jgi:hypothetical protein
MAFGMATGQDLTIRYDFIRDTFSYYHGKRKLAQPILRRNYEVRVEVKNLNPFVFIGKCDWKEDVVQENTTTSAIASLMSGGGLNFSGLTSIIGGVKLDQLLVSNDKTFSDGVSNPDTIINDEATSAIEQFEACRSSYNTLKSIEESLNHIQSSAAKLKQLKYNPYLPADTLKKMAKWLVSQSISLNKKFSETELNATAFMDYNLKINNLIGSEYENLKNGVATYNKYYEGLNRTNAEIAKLQLDKKLATMLAEAERMKEKYTTEEIGQRIEKLEQEYEHIKYTPFEYVCNYMARGDMLSLGLEFFELSKLARSENNIPGASITDTMRKIRTKSMNIIVRGDMKFTTSIGLGFPTYFKHNQNFTNPDTMIRSVAGNNFSPCVASYINFYPYRGRNAHIGGSFGIGIPVQGENTGNMNFFLGLSSVLGANSKVVINAGVAIGQVNVLNNGQRVGDILPYKEDPSTSKAFKMGGFFGISFALNK